MLDKGEKNWSKILKSFFYCLPYILWSSVNIQWINSNSVIHNTFTEGHWSIMLITVIKFQIQDTRHSIFGGENAVSSIYCQPLEETTRKLLLEKTQLLSCYPEHILSWQCLFKETNIFIILLTKYTSYKRRNDLECYFGLL